jgi:hypothetical protein
VDPDDGDSFGGILSPRKDYAAIWDTVFRLNIDKFFGQLSSCFFSGAARAPLPKQESCRQ